MLLCISTWSYYYGMYTIHYVNIKSEHGAVCSSGGRALACKGWDHPTEPAWQVYLQFGLFSVPTSGKLVHQRLWYVQSCLWESGYKRLLAAYQKE